MNKAFHIMATVTIMLSLFPLVTNSIAEEVSDTPLTSEPQGFQPSAKRGKAIFESVCAHCHNTTYEKSRIGAPGLRGVLERHDEAWINQWIHGPEAFAKKDETAKVLIESNKFGLAMPTLPVTQDANNRADIIAFLKTLK